ncbi:MAG: hypothetical protein ABJF11_13290 [Reichenbachiella sp.]|uniref:hypothetical protein n=1 Tax=Reichenbachiella sp. TaxID=2184521 RepID=UPI003267B74A
MKKILIGIALISLSFHPTFSQEQQVDIMDLIRDLQQWKKEDSNMKMVWWIPTKYWEITAKGTPNFTPEALEEIISSVDDYTIMACLDGNIGTLGFTYQETTEIKIIDKDGIEYQSIDKTTLPDNTNNLLNILKPTLANMIGQMGQNIEFYVFSNKKINGDAVLDPETAGKFSVVFNGHKFNWRLPLGSLVPRKKCPKGDELHSGSWSYCPWHGSKLVKQTK